MTDDVDLMEHDDTNATDVTVIQNVTMATEASLNSPNTTLKQMEEGGDEVKGSEDGSEQRSNTGETKRDA